MQLSTQKSDWSPAQFIEFCKAFEKTIDNPDAYDSLQRSAPSSISQTLCTFSVQAGHLQEASDKVTALSSALKCAAKDKLPTIQKKQKLTTLELRSIKKVKDLSFFTDHLATLAKNTGEPLPETITKIIKFVQLAVHVQAILCADIQRLSNDDILTSDLFFTDEVKQAKHKAKQPRTLINLFKKVCRLNFEDFRFFSGSTKEECKTGATFHMQPYVTGNMTHVGVFTHSVCNDTTLVCCAEIALSYTNSIPNLHTMSYSNHFRLDFGKLLTAQGMFCLGMLLTSDTKEEVTRKAHERFEKIIDSILSEEDQTLQQVENDPMRALRSALPNWFDKRKNISRRGSEVRLTVKSMHCSEFTGRLITKGLIRFEKELAADFLVKSGRKSIPLPLVHLPIPDTLKFKHLHPNRLFEYFKPYLKKLPAPRALQFFCQEEVYQG